MAAVRTLFLCVTIAICSFPDSKIFYRLRRYVAWLKEAYSSSAQSGLLEVLERATRTFLGDVRYANSPVYVALWAEYVSGDLNSLQCSPVQLSIRDTTKPQAELSSDAGEVFRFMHARGIGADVALLYMAWAFVAEAKGDVALADTIYCRGVARRAQPLDRLQVRCGCSSNQCGCPLQWF
jgi:checkpoint serine/threonine-protein kinase